MTLQQSCHPFITISVQINFNSFELGILTIHCKCQTFKMIYTMRNVAD
jgi:hypothetical protein